MTTPTGTSPGGRSPKTDVITDNLLRTSSAIHPIGYDPGAGSVVTQLTDAGTGVQIDTPTGQITTVALTTAAGAEERFTVTCAAIKATDVPVLGTTYAGAGTAALSVVKVAAGAFDVVISNLHATNALNAVVVINYAIIRGRAA